MQTIKTYSLSKVFSEFRFFSCVAIAASIIGTESIVDFLFYLLGTHVPGMTEVAAFIRRYHLLPVFTYGFYWWAPVVLISFMSGRFLGNKAPIHVLCGALLFLVVLHNFRGITLRHNVFEGAAEVRMMNYEGVLQPFVWDLSYFLCALICSVLGSAFWGAVGAARRRSTNTGFPVVPSLLFCMVIGLAEFCMTLVYVRPHDRYILLPPITHGAASALLAAAILWLVSKQNSYFEGQLC